MNFYLLCVCVCLAVLFCAAGVASAATALLAPVALRHRDRWPAALRASVWFALRSAPATVASIVTVGLFLPAFLKLEPSFTREPITLRLALLAAAGAAMAASTTVRFATAIVRGARVEAQWRNAATRLCLGIGVRAFEVPHAGNLVATTGLIFPSIFISSDIVQALTPAELRAAVQHEVAHASAHDNLKRLIVWATPLPVARTFAALERAWAQDCELTADDAALRMGSPVLELASALVKCARLRSVGQAGLATASFLVPAGQESALADRLRRLAHLMQATAPIPPQRRYRIGVLAVAALALTLALFSSPAVLRAAHDIIERLV